MVEREGSQMEVTDTDDQDRLMRDSGSGPSQNSSEERKRTDRKENSNNDNLRQVQSSQTHSRASDMRDEPEHSDRRRASDLICSILKNRNQTDRDRQCTSEICDKRTRGG